MVLRVLRVSYGRTGGLLVTDRPPLRAGAGFFGAGFFGAGAGLWVFLTGVILWKLMGGPSLVCLLLFCNSSSADLLQLPLIYF